MPLALREAEVLWEGPLARGAGTLTSEAVRSISCQ